MRFKIMGTKGDAALDYADPEVAEIKFDELMLDMIPVARDKDVPARILKHFDPDVNEVVWIPKIAGG